MKDYIIRGCKCHRVTTLWILLFTVRVDGISTALQLRIQGLIILALEGTTNEPEKARSERQVVWIKVGEVPFLVHNEGSTLS